MSIINKKIKTEINFFYYEKFSAKTLEEVVDFFTNPPENKKGKKEALIDEVILRPLGDNEYRITININVGIIKEVTLYPGKYYCFSGEYIREFDSLDDMKIRITE